MNYYNNNKLQSAVLRAIRNGESQKENDFCMHCIFIFIIILILYFIFNKFVYYKKQDI